MKSSSIALLLATAGSFVAASPSGHRHQHKHAEKRNPDHTKVIEVPGPTVVAYELNGQLIQESEVCDGIQAGKLKWAGGAQAGTDVCSKSSQPVATSTPAPVVPSPSSVVAPVEAYQQPTSSASPTATFTQVQSSSSSTPASSASAAAPPPASSSPASSSSSSSSSDNTNPGSGEGLDKPFPDHEVGCSHFPSEYGPIDVSWLGFGGWSGVSTPPSLAIW